MRHPEKWGKPITVRFEVRELERIKAAMAYRAYEPGSNFFSSFFNVSQFIRHAVELEVARREKDASDARAQLSDKPGSAEPRASDNPTPRSPRKTRPRSTSSGVRRGGPPRKTKRAAAAGGGSR